MPYPITDPLNIPIDFTGIFVPPEVGTNIVLRFGVEGEMADYRIVQGQNSIHHGGDHIVNVFIDVIPSENQHKIITVDHVSELMDVIEAMPSEMLLSDAGTVVELLIDAIPELSEIRLQIPEALIERLPEVYAQLTDILIQSDVFELGGGQPNDLPVRLSLGGFDFKWSKPEASVSVSFDTLWNKPDEVRVTPDIPWDAPIEIIATNSFIFDSMPIEDQHKRVPWDALHNTDAKVVANFDQIMDYLDHNKIAWWGGFMPSDERIVNPYKVTMAHEGDFQDRHIRKPWDTSLYFDKEVLNPFDNDVAGQFKTEHHGTYWGPYWYSLWCKTKYYPPLKGELLTIDLTKILYALGPLNFTGPVKNSRCPYLGWHSGVRDSKPWDIPVITSLVTERKKVYYMLNSAFIKRLPSNEDIAFESLSMSIDRGSWTWGFDVTLPKKDYLDLIKPVGTTLVDIEINVNGWKWICRVENWREAVVFGKKSWVISGRSPSVELGEPYLVEPFFSNASGHGGQVIDQILNGTGWAADWQEEADFNPHTEWLLPESLINMTDSSKIQQIQTVVASVSAFMQTAADTITDKKFIIRPTYKKNPWAWNTVTPTAVLTDAICHEIGRANNILKPVNSVIVTGDHRGVVVRATKDGTAGDMTAPMDVNPLITTEQAGRERARHIIGSSGFWINHSMRLFSLTPPATAPGLLIPGDFIQMWELGVPAWVGQITGTNISVSWSNGLVVSQQLEVEQFYG